MDARSRTGSVSLAALLCLAVAAPAEAQEDLEIAITPERVVELLATRNPVVRAAIADVSRTEQLVLAEQGRYAARFQLDGGVTHTRSPRLSGADETVSASIDSIVFGAQLAKQYPWGTSVTLRVQGDRTSAESQLFPNSDQTVTSGPGYGVVGRLTVLHPLLRGAGRDVGEAELRAARLQRDATQRARDRVAGEQLRDALNGYWELWYSGEALAIEREALALAEEQLRAANERIDAGALAPVEALPFESRVADLEEAVAAAEEERRRRSIALARFIGSVGKHSGSFIAASDALPEVREGEGAGDVELALRESPEIRERELQVALAENRASIAGESERTRLDLEAYLQAEGLGNRRLVPAFEQLGTAGAVSAHVGLVLELPIDGSRRRAQAAAERLSVSASREQLEAARQAVEAEVRTVLLREQGAERRTSLAHTSVRIAEKQLEAVEQRFRAGEAIPIEVREAEEALRRARLRLMRSRVDYLLAQLARDYLTGRLLLRHRHLLPPEPSAVDSPRGPF